MNWLRAFAAAGKVVGTGDSETAQDGARGDAIAEEDHVIDDGWVTFRVGIGALGMGSRQHHAPHRFERDAVVAGREKEHCLAGLLRPVGSRVDLDGLVD